MSRWPKTRFKLWFTLRLQLWLKLPFTLRLKDQLKERLKGRLKGQLKVAVAGCAWLAAAIGPPAVDAVEPERASPLEVELEFLEFLGQWETASGEWLDPLQFEHREPAEEDDEATN